MDSPFWRPPRVYNMDRKSVLSTVKYVSEVRIVSFDHRQVCRKLVEVWRVRFDCRYARRRLVEVRRVCFHHSQACGILVDSPNFYQSDYTLGGGLSELQQASKTLGGGQNSLSELLLASYILGSGQNRFSELLQASYALGCGQTDSLKFYKSPTRYAVVYYNPTFTSLLHL